MTFGFLIDWISSHYHQQVWRGVDEYCRTNGINLLTLVTGRPGSPFRWEQMRNQLLEFVGAERFDGFLFMTATLGNHLDEAQFRQLLGRVAPSPVVSLGAELPGVPGILVDNRGGFQAILEHLHLHHGHRRFAYAGGPRYNIDARERLKLFQAYLRDHDLDYRPDRILSGEFSSTWGQRAIELLVGEGRPDFDVLVCANDEIAMGAIEALARRGLQVPGDLKVTGFDDVQTSGAAGLTTARQALADLGRRGADLLHRQIVGQPVDRLSRTETRLVIRQSCGCLSLAELAAEVEPRSEFAESFDRLAVSRRDQIVREMGADGLRPAVSEALLEGFLEAWKARDAQLFHHRLQGLLNGPLGRNTAPGDLHLPLSVLRGWVLRSSEPAAQRSFGETLVHRARIYLTEVLHVRMVQRETNQFLLKDLLSDLNERLLYSKSFQDQSAVLLDLFPRLGIHRFRLALYEDPAQPMAQARLVLTEAGEVPDAGLLYHPLELFAPGYEPRPEPWSFVAEALFDRNAPLGFFLLDPHGEPELLTVFDQLCERVGRGVETVRRILDLEDQVAARTDELREALEDLEAYNIQLKELALRDELTGLYNRRGFITLAEHQLKAHYRRGPAMVLFFCDLDGLKIINDTRGHDAGDEALRTAGRLLTETFRKEDLVARLSGDEFVVLVPGCTAEGAGLLSTRLDEAFAATGRYSLSHGWITVDPRTHRSLTDWLKDADDLLYRQKAAKKARRAGQAK